MTESNLNLIVSSSFFSEIDESFFPKHRTLKDIIIKDCVIREYKKGEVIIREGDYGTSAFVIINGSVWYLIDNIHEHLFTQKRKVGKRSTFASIFYRQKKEYTNSENLKRQVLKDKTIEKLKKIRLEKGDIFGETSGRDPRTATIIAEQNSVIVEIKWQGVRDLKKFSPEISEIFDSLYKARSLKKIIKENKLFVNLNDDDLNIIIKESILESRGNIDELNIDPDREKELISIGNYVNGLIIIRAGFAKISDLQGNTIKYLTRGDNFGLNELFFNWQNNENLSHQYSLTYLGYLETIFIPKIVVQNVILPKLTAKPDQIIKSSEIKADPNLLNFFVTNRYNNARSLMIIDLERCTRCNECVQACSTTHQNIPRFNREGKQHGKYLVAKSCMHCSEPYCMNDCPTGAIYRDEINGEIIINEETCIGCANCAENCIYENISMFQIPDKAFEIKENKPVLKASKCDLCIDEYSSTPACERSCPTEALKRVDFSDYDSFVEWAEQKI